MSVQSIHVGSEYSTKVIFQLMAVLAGVILALKVSEFSMYLIAAMVIYSISQKKTEVAFFMLVLLTALSVINPLLVVKGFNFYLVTRGSLFILAAAMAVKASFKRSAWFMSPFYWLFAYVFYMMASSLVGWAPIVSELKAILFLVFMAALVQSVAAVSQSEVDIGKIRAAFLVLALFYIVGSVLVIPFPSVGQSMIVAKYAAYGNVYDPLDSSGLFNGLTWHSQTLGPLVAVLNACILSDYLCNFKKKNTIYRILLVCAPILVYRTSSRTALFAYLISLLATAYFFGLERRASRAKKTKVMMASFSLGLMGLLVFVLRPGTAEKMQAFLRKSHDVATMDTSRSLTEDLTKTRIGLVESGMANFRASPLIGNGFQVSEQMQAYDVSEMGLILSAPIEKGVLPVMVLEEGGVIGASIFVAFVCVLYVKYRRLQFTCFLSTFTVFIALNSGEATFFSTSGSGGILWMICFCALLMDVYRHRRVLREMQQQYMLQAATGHYQ